MTMSPAPPGVATLVFANYQLPGDAMTLTFAIEPKSIQTVNVATWLDSPSKPVTLTVQFQSLPDGTNYPATTTLTLPSVETRRHGHQRGLSETRDVVRDNLSRRGTSR